jgi:hypothetical protein
MPQPYPQPQPPKKKRGVLKFGCLGFVGIIVIAGIASAGGGGKGDNSSSSSTSSSSSASSKAPAHKSAPQENTVDAFKAYAKKNESSQTSAAVQHVTKVQGGDSQNDILDAADVYTSYSGGLMSADTGKAKLIASAFADFQKSRGKSSKNGLVTVYGADGDLLSNGKY